MEELLIIIKKYMPLVIDGTLSNKIIDHVNIVLVYGTKIIYNNFFILWLGATAWQRFSKKTDATWDDKWSGRLVAFLSRFKPGGAVQKSDTAIKRG